MKIKMLETTVFEGQRYEAGKEYEIEEEKAKALGASVKIIETAKNTMMMNKEVKKKAKK